jgi:hypothetical protein
MNTAMNSSNSGRDETPATPPGTGTMACRRCGACCTMHQAFVNPEEIRRIVVYLGVTMDDWDRYYEDSRWEYNSYRLVRHVNGACVFLKYERNGLATCIIHAVKPGCCANWQPGPDRKECQEGAARQAKDKINP